MCNIIVTLRSHKKLSIFQPWNWPRQTYLDWTVIANKQYDLFERGKKDICFQIITLSRSSTIIF